MATATKKKPVARKTAAKKPASVKRAAPRKRTASAASASTQYTNFTWALVITWLVLIIVFLGVILLKLY